MHELSLVMSIIDIAADHLQRAHASTIEEIEMEIGTLSGVEMSSFDFAWEQAVKQTPLEGAQRTIHRIEGRGACTHCGIEFALENLYDGCPVCGGHLIHVVRGKELRVKSLVVT